ncbi:MAG: T9SS type A sorting domain-containing protein [Syntrophothermus sp.]
MKKLFFIFLLSGIAVFIRANPIDDTPVMKFSELVFDGQNKWEIELLFPFTRYYNRIDSILIKSARTTAKLRITLLPDKKIYVISQDSLYSQLTINPLGDTITIETYSQVITRLRTDKTVFGDYPGSTVSAPKPGWSICKDQINTAGPHTYLSPKPTIGSVNTPEAIAQKIKGKIFDINGHPVTGFKTAYSDSIFLCLHLPFIIDKDGTYTTKFLPHVYQPDSVRVDYLLIIWQYSSFLYDWQYTEPFYITYINADTVLTRDIRLKSSKYAITGVSGRPEGPESEVILINYPNPFNSSTNFFVKFPGGMKERGGEIKVYNASGEHVRTIEAKDGKTALWNGKDMRGYTVSSGIYYFQLNIGNKSKKSGSMILLK